MSKNINTELLSKCIGDINDNLIVISKLFPKGNNDILKHAASASIHIALFTQDLAEIFSEEKIETLEDKKIINEFLEKCGCNKSL